MANEWRKHVSKTMEEMKKSSPKGVTVMLKDVLKKAKETYKKGESKVSEEVHHSKTVKKGGKRKSSKRAKTTKKRKSRKSSKKSSKK